MKKKRVDRGIVVLLISTLVTLAAWVGFEIYRAYNQAKFPEDLESILIPLEPKLETKVLDILEERNQ